MISTFVASHIPMIKGVGLLCLLPIAWVIARAFVNKTVAAPAAPVNKEGKPIDPRDGMKRWGYRGRQTVLIQKDTGRELPGVALKDRLYIVASGGTLVRANRPAPKGLKKKDRIKLREAARVQHQRQQTEMQAVG